MRDYPGRILGLDYGSKRIGVAVSDPTRLIAQGVTTLESDGSVFGRIAEIVKREQVACVVVGMPYSADGGKGKKALEVDEFIGELRKHIDAEIDTWDESYSSVNAHQTFISTGMTRKKRRQKSRVDEMAARLMLQEYLDNERVIGSAAR